MKQTAKLSVLHIALLFLGFCLICNGLPVLDLFQNGPSDENLNIPIYDNSTSNRTSKNLYVVKAVVYEVGILTDASSSEENDTSSEERQERVDLTFFDAHKKNNNRIDLGRIPLPIQTNVSGQVLTGIAPVDIGAFSNPAELFNTLPLTGTIVNITHSDTAYFKLTERNASDIDDVNFLSPSEISKIPQIAEWLPSVIDNPNSITFKNQKVKT